MEEKKYLKKAIQWAKKRGYSNIKANIDEFEQPTQFSKPNEDQPYTPDITGQKLGRKIYIEIATKTENMQRRISKWKLLSTLAEMKGGKLFLLAPRGHKAFVERQLKKYHLNAKLVYLPNL
jgi:hypothetical protein